MPPDLLVSCKRQVAVVDEEILANHGAGCGDVVLLCLSQEARSSAALEVSWLERDDSREPEKLAPDLLVSCKRQVAVVDYGI